jgi:hypothetical protein
MLEKVTPRKVLPSSRTVDMCDSILPTSLPIVEAGGSNFDNNVEGSGREKATSRWSSGYCHYRLVASLVAEATRPKVADQSHFFCDLGRQVGD